MNKLLELNSCHPGPNFNPNPFAVGKRWLAYSPYSLLANLQSAGGVASDDGHSYVATALSAVKTIGKGISTFSDTVNWLASKSHLTSSSEDGAAPSRDHLWNMNKPSSESSEKREASNVLPGRVTILDLKKILSMEQQNDGCTKLSLEDCNNPKAVVVAHFVAHLHRPVAKLEFGPAGRLLATADDQGHTFHVFSIFSHPTSSQLSAVHHLYSLCRGDTLAQVQELRFSWDSRWLCASTFRGTCHIFPITPYGGMPTVRTHATDRMVNRSSRFHKSAGLDDIEYSEPKNRSSQLIAEGAALAQGVLGWKTNYRSVSARSTMHNPRYPPLPHPVVVQALVHVRPGTTNSVASTLPGVIPTPTPFLTQSSEGSNPPGPNPMDIVISTRFLETRKNESELRQVASNGSSSGRSSSPGSQRLLIASSSGYLTEYLLEPRPHNDKVANDSPVELIATPCVCWPLQRHTTWSTVPLTLSPRNPLISYTEKCRKYYAEQKIRTRPDVTENRRPSQNGFAAPPANEMIDRNGNAVLRKVCSEQPTSRSHAAHNSLRNKTPGGAVAQSELTKTTNLKSEHHIVIGETNNTKKCESWPRGDEWLSQVEMVTHEGPARRLWMGPQFHFKPLQSIGSTHVISHASSALLSDEPNPADQFGCNGFPVGGAEDAFNEELDLESLKLQSRRSDPVPTPNSRSTNYPNHDGIGDYGNVPGITIETGSGNFDRSAHMLEISAYGSVEDRRYSSFGGRIGEEKLKERIADAMVDLNRGGRGADLSSRSPPDSSNNSFSSMTPPSLKLGRTGSDTGDFGVPLVTEHFDFNVNNN